MTLRRTTVDGSVEVPLDPVFEHGQLLIGGEPFGEEIVMLRNFVGRGHDEIVAFREKWMVASEPALGEEAEHRPTAVRRARGVAQ